jgi:hypothetical protein
MPRRSFADNNSYKGLTKDELAYEEELAEESAAYAQNLGHTRAYTASPGPEHLDRP